jgi:hypothetical protein
MAVTINTDGFAINFASSIDRRLIVDRVDGTTASLVSLEPNYNYRNMYVWVKEEKAFYYLIDTPDEGGATVSDWAQASGGVGGSASAIDFEEIAFGTGTGITSSNLFTFDVSKANLIFGTNSISASTDAKLGRNNVVIGGCCNDIYQNNFSELSDGLKNSIILGGEYNSLKQSIDAAIIGGSGSIICSADCSIIGGGEGNYLRSVQKSTIIGGSDNKICSSRGSGIFAGDENTIYSSGLVGNECCRSVIIGGSKNYSHSSEDSTILGGKSGSLTQSNRSGILGGCENTIFSSNNSVIIGGIGLTLSNEDSVVYVPELKISTASNSSTTDKVLVWDTTDNYVKYRDVSTIGGNVTIDLTEIAFGTGTGITSSNDFRLETGNNLILSNKSSINSSSFSSIIGGACFSTITASQYSTLISSYLSSIKSSNCSSIIGSYGSSICNSNGSVIIGNYNGGIKNSSFSTNVGGAFNCIDNTGIPGAPNYGGIVFGILNKLCNSVNASSIFSGSSNIISGTLSARDNIILGGNDNKICGLSKYSSIVGGVTNSMTASYHSSIIGGYSNEIIGGVGIGIVPVKYSSIIGGYKNCIISKFNFGTSKNSVIIGGCNNKILYAQNSAIIGGDDLTINGQASNPFALSNVVYVPSLKGHGSLQLQVTTSSTDTSLDDTNFTLIAYPSLGGMTVSLPKAEYAPNRLYIIKKDGSSTQSVVYIDPNVSDTIEGYAGSIELINPWDYNMLQSDGVNMWIKLGGAVGINL